LEGAETYDVPGRPKAANLDLIFLCHQGRFFEAWRNSLFHFSMGAKVKWTRIIQPMTNPTTNPPTKNIVTIFFKPKWPLTFWGGTALSDQNLFFSIRLSIRKYLKTLIALAPRM
jgi:hypothetical protein